MTCFAYEKMFWQRSSDNIWSFVSKQYC